MAAWVGVDVGGKRKGFDVAVIHDRRILALQGHLTRKQVVDLVIENRPTVIAIDSPCCCGPGGQTARDGELRLAKSSCGIRWTPGARHVHASAYYAWIREGLGLFEALAAHGVEIIEVFPTASWTRWQRDAIAAAMTARQHTLALTETIGDIVVPVGRW